MNKQKTSHRTFSKSEAIRFGWEVAKKNFWFFFAMLIISYGIQWLFSFIYNPLIKSDDVVTKVAGFLMILAGWIVNLEINFAQLTIYFKFFDKKKAELRILFAYFETGLLFRYLLVSFLYRLIFFGGLIFFIIPGIYFATKYWFAPYIYVDKRIGVIESFKESAKLTKGIKWQLFLLLILQMLICIGGALALLVGLVIAIPINYLSDVYVYRKLSAEE
jgi:uncharacterized membrane protein